MNETSRMHFYKQYGDFVNIFDVAVWLILSIAGILPGIGKNRMGAEKLREVAAV